MKSINEFCKLPTVVLVLALSACGGGSIASGSATGAAVVAQDAQVKSLAYVKNVGEVNYQDVHNLAGTGKAGMIAPADLITHYNIPTAAKGGLTGAGQTIVIVDAPGSIYGAAIQTDLNTFSAFYNLPQCNTANPCFQQIDQSNGAKIVANSTADWKGEVALDTQWAHAIAPGAKIVLVTAKSSGLTDMMAAVQTAAGLPNVVAISMSWGVYEFSGETGAAYDGVMQKINAQGIVLLASSGDNGNNGSNQIWPAASPYITSVGGTSISTMAYNLPSVTTESAWSNGGGGASLYEPKPIFQTAPLLGATVTSLDPTKRAIPDVSYNADPNKSGMTMVVGGGWFIVGGTSAGAPQWAGIVALLSQERVIKKETTLPAILKATFPTTGFNGFLYQVKVDSVAMYDVTAGSDGTGARPCGLCTAGKGYDAVTGLGVPNGTNLLAFF